MELLLNHQADIHARDNVSKYISCDSLLDSWTLPSYQLQNGQTALHRADGRTNLLAIEVLLNHGADIHAVDKVHAVMAFLTIASEGEINF